MIRKTYTILAVALTTTACAGTVSTQREMSKQELAQELSTTPLEDALKNREHFAPLCDGDGYPLPGNMNSKESGSSKLSQVCDALKPRLQRAPIRSPRRHPFLPNLPRRHVIRPR
jgi:hypothetical protein